jgi:hypothetical protein
MAESLKIFGTMIMLAVSLLGFSIAILGMIELYRETKGK